MESHASQQESGVDREQGVVVVGSRSERVGQLRSDEQVLSQLNSLRQQRAKLTLRFTTELEDGGYSTDDWFERKQTHQRGLTNDISSSEQLTHFPESYFVGRQEPCIEYDL